MTSTYIHGPIATASAAAAAVLATVALVACSAGDGTGNSANNSGGDPRTVSAENGEVEIPADPQRVAVMDWQLPTALVDLEVIPVAIYEGYFEVDAADTTGVPEMYVEALEDVPRVGTFQEPSVEKLAEVEPDLILTTQTTVDDTLLEKLEEVAPTVQLSTDGNWLDLQERAAEVLDRQDEYDNLLDEYTTRADGIRESHRDLLDDTTWAPISGTTDGQWLYEGGRTPTGTLLGDVGIRFVDAVDEDGFWGDPRSAENIGELGDASALVFPVMSDGSNTPGMEMLMGNEAFRQLPAVQNDMTFGLQISGVSSLGWALLALDTVDDVLTEADQIHGES